MNQHLKTKLHLDNVKGKYKDKTGDDNDNIARMLMMEHGQRPILKLKDIVIYVNPDITIKMNTMNQMNIKKMLYRKKPVDKKWRDKVNELGLDHNMKYNQIMIKSSNYEDIKFLNVLEEMYNIHPHIKFNTFDVVKYTKPTDDKLQENEFTFRLMTCNILVLMTWIC